jgi:predicted amidohydrolase
MVWAKGDGSTLQVFNTELGRIGGLICYEHWMPLTRYALESDSVQVFASVWPTIVVPTSLAAAQHMAVEGRCFVVMAGAYMTKDQLPQDFELLPDLGNFPDVIFNGGSSIIGPDGRFMVDPVYDREAIIYADVDLERILEEKQMLDVAGHYARPEVLTLNVDRRPFRAYRSVGENLDIAQELSSLESLAEDAPREELRESIRKLRERLSSG